MNLTDKSILELEVEAGELRATRQRHSIEKQALQSQLATIKAACATRLQRDQYAKLQRDRAAVLQQLATKESEISEINAAIAEIHTVMEVRKRQANQIVVGEVKELVAMRDRWHEFSMERSNHQKAREAAFKFSQELRDLLKNHFAKAIES